MTPDPASCPPRLHRRAFALRAGTAVASMTLLGAVLSACGRSTSGSAASSSTAVPTAAPAPTMGPTMSGMAATPLTDDNGTPVPTDHVTIDNFAFRPRSVVVTAGTTVTWTNHDDVPHTVTNRQMLFGSQALDTDEHYAHRFDTPGTYAYFCAIHPAMTGVVIVR